LAALNTSSSIARVVRMFVIKHHTLDVGRAATASQEPAFPNDLPK
jgi:hypothetical protein